MVVSPTTSDGTIGRPASAQACAPSPADVERLELDPLLAKELPGRRARRSGRLPEQRHSFHSAIIAVVKIAVVGAGAMGSVYAGLLGSAGNEVWAVDLLAGAHRRDPRARPAGRGGERRPRRAGSGDDGRGRGRRSRARRSSRPRRWTSRPRPRPRDRWSGRTRSCSRSRTASAAPTSPRASSARTGWPSASPAGSAPRSSHRGTRITTASSWSGSASAAAR